MSELPDLHLPVAVMTLTYHTEHGCWEDSRFNETIQLKCSVQSTLTVRDSEILAFVLGVSKLPQIQRF